MSTRAKGISFRNYIARFWHRFYADAAPWARDNIFWGLVVLLIPPIAVVVHNSTARVDWDIIKTTLWLYLFSLLVYGFVHAIRTPWRIDQERERDIQTIEQEKHELQVRLASAEISLNDQSPKVHLQYSEPGTDFMSNTGLILHNAGKRTAFAIRLRCNSPKVRLDFQGMPIQRIDPEDEEPVELLTEYLNEETGLWYAIGGVRGVQVRGCFEWLHTKDLLEVIPVAITYKDYDGREYAINYAINHEDNFLGTGRIWCEKV